jgi:hypothetical protein
MIAVREANALSRLRKNFSDRRGVVGPCVAVNDPLSAGNRRSATTASIRTSTNLGAKVSIATGFYTGF